MDSTQGNRPVSGEEVRKASFPPALRGYDRDSVHAFLDRVADWLDAGAVSAGPATGVTGEFTKVGERTAGILNAAEEAASKLRSEAKAYADGLRSSAEEESRKAKLGASQRADQLISEAEGKAERIIDDAIARRRRLNQAVSSLLERRDEIAGEAQRLADELLEAVDAMRDEDLDADEDRAAEPDGQNGGEPVAALAPDQDDDEEPDDDELAEVDADEADEDAQDPQDPAAAGDGRNRFVPPSAAEPTELEPPDERETTVHRTDGPR